MVRPLEGVEGSDPDCLAGGPRSPVHFSRVVEETRESVDGEGLPERICVVPRVPREERSESVRTDDRWEGVTVGRDDSCNRRSITVTFLTLRPLCKCSSARPEAL